MNTTQLAADPSTVLVVDDDRELADMYRFQLADHYTVRTAYSGPDAIDALDESVAVMLLDRQMSGLSGSAVLQRIRDSAHDCRVIMITAADPSLDIIGLPCDDYLCKPVTKSTLIETVDQQFTVRKYDQPLQQLFRNLSKLQLLEAEHPQWVLERSTEYQQLHRETDRLRTKATAAVGEFDAVESAFTEIDRSTTLTEHDIES